MGRMRRVGFVRRAVFVCRAGFRFAFAKLAAGKDESVRITVVAVGKLKEKFWKQACEGVPQATFGVCEGRREGGGRCRPGACGRCERFTREGRRCHLVRRSRIGARDPHGHRGQAAFERAVLAQARRAVPCGEKAISPSSSEAPTGWMRRWLRVPMRRSRSGR